MPQVYRKSCAPVKNSSYTNVRLPEGDMTRSLQLRMRLLPGRQSDEALAVVFFENIEESPAKSNENQTEYDLNAETGRQLQDLEQELQFTRENLQSTIEELETSNEELQATNEELLASNEELQSTNEELQSANEELYTVNSEYQNKIIEVTEANHDVENLLSSSRIGTLILDEDMCIRRYSPQAAKVFHLVDSDIGRPLTHLSHQLGDFDAVALARNAQQAEETLEYEAEADDGLWYMVRALPYQVGPQTVAGVVLTLIDITPLHRTRKELEHSRQSGADILQHMPAGLFIYDVTEQGELVLNSGNHHAWQIIGLDSGTCLGRRFEELWPGDRDAFLRNKFLQAYRTDTAMYEPEVHYSDERVDGVFHIHAFRLPGSQLAVGLEDISKRKEAENALKESEKHHRHLYRLLADAEKTARMGSWTWDVANDTVTWSENLYILFRRDKELGAPSFAEHDTFYTHESMARLREAVQETLERGTPYTLKLEALRSDNSIMACVARGKAEHDETGVVYRLYGSLQELDE